MSSAYYAAFHLLSVAATERVAAGSSVAAQHALRRSLTHAGMAAVCKVFVGTEQPSRAVAPLKPAVVPTGLVAVAAAFIDLQEGRHNADYDLATAVLRQDATGAVERARNALTAWFKVGRTPEAGNFLFALVLGNR